MGKGIRYSMLSSLPSVLKALDLRAAVFASGDETNQQAAAYAGFEEIHSVSFERIEEMINFDLKTAPANDFKMMAFKLEQ